MSLTGLRADATLLPKDELESEDATSQEENEESPGPGDTGHPRRRTAAVSPFEAQGPFDVQDARDAAGGGISIEQARMLADTSRVGPRVRSYVSKLLSYAGRHVSACSHPGSRRRGPP